MLCVIAVRATDKRIACDEEFSDSEDEGQGGRRNTANHKKGTKRPKVDEDKESEEKKADVKEEDKTKDSGSEKAECKGTVKTEQTSSA
ncbi:Histone deacetylase 2 [Characodon lateralis]|uniref:Histone deacetylase 2 n=1 Tax=Characodon lateralis TaxID=208331 RepID=A0ABU7CZG2_9TELE|nr:Histone deacetylase 2 [Characodon lateralis]